MYCINFDALADNVTITKKLDEYDRLVYTAVSALYNSGYKEMSASMIYNVMGYTGRPSGLSAVCSALSQLIGPPPTGSA